MKILGHARLQPRVKRVVVGMADGVAVELEVRAPGLLRMDAIEGEIVTPTPPISGVVKDPKTGVVMKDEHGRPIPILNGTSAAHRKAVKRVALARTCALVIECLGEQITPETKREDHLDAVGYYFAILEELEAAGLSLGAFNQIATAARELIDVPSDEEFRAAEKELGAEKDTSGN